MSCSIAAVFFYARYTPRLTFTIPRRTFDDVGNCGSLRRIATAFYPLVVSDLRIVVLMWIRERFASGAVFGPLRCRRVRSRLRGDWYRFSDRYRSCRGRSRCAWSRSFDCYQSHRSAWHVPCPPGEIGVTASSYTLSQVALVIASGHAGDYLPLLAARGQESQDGGCCGGCLSDSCCF